MSENVGQGQDELAIITDKLIEVDLVFIGHDLDDWSEDQTEDGIYHGYIRQLGRVATQEAPTLIIVVLASVGDVRQLVCVSLHGKVVDRVHVEIYVRLLVDGLESELVEVIWSAKFLIFELFSGFIVADVDLFVAYTTVRED